MKTHSYDINMLSCFQPIRKDGVIRERYDKIKVRACGKRAIVAIATYLISTAAGFLKYHRWPSCHTRAAKTSWFLIVIGAIGLFTDWSL